MIHHDISRPGSECDAVILLAGQIAETAAQVTHDDIMCSDHERVIAQADAIARRRLARDGDVGIFDNQFSRQSDQAGNAKDNDAGTFGFTRGAETARPVVAEICYRDYLAAATSRRRRAKAFSAGKGSKLSRSAGAGDSLTKQSGQHEHNEIIL